LIKEVTKNIQYMIGVVIKKWRNKIWKLLPSRVPDDITIFYKFLVECDLR